MSRRPNGTGSITTLPDGRLVVRATDPATGRRVKQLVVRGVRDDDSRRPESPAAYRRRAERALAELRRELARPVTLRESWTVESWARERYLPSVAERVRPRTAESYEQELRLWVYPHVGHVPLDRLTVDHVDQLDRTLADQGHGLVVRRKARGCLSRVLKHAVAKRRVDRNVAADADRLRTGDVDRTKGVLEGDEVAKLLAAARGTDFKAPVALLALLGLRRGELCGLAWECVDLDAGTITIARSMATLRGGRLLLSSPKTAGSRRTLTLSPPLVAALRAHRARQTEWRLAAGDAWAETFADEDGEHVHLVYVDEAGRPRGADQINDALDRLTAQAAVPRVTPHRLRHSAASLMIEAGADVASVAGVLGHASPAVTLSVYSHALRRGVARATETIASAIGDW